MSKISIKKLHTFLGHNDSLYCLVAMDEKQFFSSGADGMVVLWDLVSPDEGEVVARVEGSVYAMVYNPEDHTLYVGENNNGIHKIDLASKKEIGSVQTGNDQIFDLKIVNDQLLCVLQSGELLVLNKSLQVLSKQQLANDRLRSIDANDLDIAIGASDNKTKILSKKTLELKMELEAHKNSVFAARYHPSGKYLVSVGRDAHLKVWDTSSDYILRESIAAHLYTINHLAFSHDGKYFVTCSMDKSIKLWNAHNFKLLKVLDKHRHAGHGNSVNKLLWMKYQDLLVSCSDDRTISVWEIKLEE